MGLGFKSNPSGQGEGGAIQVNGIDVIQISESGIENSVTTITHASTVNLDFSDSSFKNHTVTTAFTYTTSNLSPGRKQVIRLMNTSGSSYNIIFPNDWTFVGSSEPSSIAAGKDALLEITCFGLNNASCLAEWRVEP